MEHDLLKEVLVLLVISVITITIFGRLRIPSIVSYMIVGVITGPGVLGLIHTSDVTRLLGEIGVVFLLFTIGLDFSVTRFQSMKKTLFGLGGAQVLVGTICGGIIAWSIGIAWEAALIVGGALALSSTAIVVKQLGEQLELHTEPGRLSFSILLFQDLAAVPFLVLIPALAEGEIAGWLVLTTLLKGFLALAVILMLGRWALRPLLHEIAATRSLELFTLTVLLISLAAAWLTYKMGLSLALGAFLAGMMLSETAFRHQIEAEIRPFRDILLGLFFITVGLQLDLALLPDIWFWVLLLVTGVMIGKGFVIYVLLKVCGYDNINSMRTGLILGQGGEFGIALLILAVFTGLLSPEDSHPILMAIIVSMSLAPVVIKFNENLASGFFRRETDLTKEEHYQEIEKATRDISDYVVICGFGHVGQKIAEALYQQNIKYIGLDNNPEVIKTAWRQDDPVYFGDTTHLKILEAAGMQKARALVICLDNSNAILKTLHAARSLSKEIPVIVRARDDASAVKLREAGADEVIIEKLETGFMMASQLLLLLDKSPDEVYEQIRILRSDH